MVVTLPTVPAGSLSAIPCHRNALALKPSTSGRRLRQASAKEPDHLTENGK
jgi:hypothetical protein